MSSEVRFEGFDSFNDKLDHLTRDLNRVVLNKAQRLAQEIADDARDLAPVATGHLRENIYWNTEENGDVIEAEVVSGADYSIYVEFGTGKVGERAGLVREGISLSYRQTPWSYKDEKGEWHYTNGMRPQPYMYPAMKQNEEKVKKELGSAITMELK